MKFQITKVATAAAVALALPIAAVSPATQAALITDWGYTVTSNFVAYQDEDGNTSTINNTTGDPGLSGNPFGSTTFDTLAWSDDAGDTSSIGVEQTVADSTSPALLTNTATTTGNTVAGATLYHDNQILNSAPAILDTATILSSLVLTPLLPPTASGNESVSLGFVINFKETDNDSTGPGPGPDGILGNADDVAFAGCPGNSQSNCDDIFELAEPTGPLTSVFTRGGFKYTVLFNVSGLGPLLDSACDAAIDNYDGLGCVGLLTQENQLNTITTSFSISAVRVPAPGTLSILALGLLCLVWAGFRRNGRMS